MNKINYTLSQIQSLVQSFDGFVVIYRSTCPYSQAAVNTLEKSGHPLQKIELSQIQHPHPKQAILDTISSIPSSHTTVPMIFYKSKFIGGNDKLKNYLSTLPK
jgi:glutaredoxin